MARFHLNVRIICRGAVALLLLLSAVEAYAQRPADLKYYDVQELGLPILGKGFENTGNPFSRLPQDLKGVIRKEVWQLGQNSAGLAVRFSTNSSAIAIRWDLISGFVMHHMTGIGIRGLDLYTLVEGKWLYVGAAQPYKVDGGESSRNCRSMVRKNIEPLKNSRGEQIGDGSREYLLYLPLYDGIEKLSIGIDSTASITKPRSGNLLPGKSGKPVVFYGTSVTQGGCATRPGMAYTNIISRERQIEVVNLGFSGNGRMDKLLADKIAKMDARAIFLDCLGNCTYKIIKDSAEYFIRTIASADPQRPLYLVSNYAYAYQYIDRNFRSDLDAENSLWYSLYLKFRKEGYKNVKFVNLSGGRIGPEIAESIESGAPRSGEPTGGNLEKSPCGPDHEGSVDGVHLTDIGFQRVAKEFMKHIK